MKIFFNSYSEKKGVFDKCQLVLKSVGIASATDEDCANVRYVCQCVSRRAAHLVSAGIAGLIDKMGKNNVTVAVDGSVYRYHPHFHDLMMMKTSELLSSPAKVRFYFLLKIIFDSVFKKISH